MVLPCLVSTSGALGSTSPPSSPIASHFLCGHSCMLDAKRGCLRLFVYLDTDCFGHAYHSLLVGVFTDSSRSQWPSLRDRGEGRRAAIDMHSDGLRLGSGGAGRETTIKSCSFYLHAKNAIRNKTFYLYNHFKNSYLNRFFFF